MFEVPMNLKALEKEVVAYEQQPIEKGKILFYGPSVFTRWGGAQWGYRRMEDDLRGKDGSLAVINHGFGTSTSEELLYYYPRLVRPWEPKALVLLSLGNDGMYGIGIDRTLSNVFRICHWARTDFPDIKIYLVEFIPNPKAAAAKIPDRWNRDFHRTKDYNETIALYAQTKENTEVIRLWDRPEFFETEADVGDPHKVRKDIFVEDMIHYNQAGYDLLAKIMREALDDLL